MPADVLAKLIIGIVTGLLLLGLIISFIMPSSPRVVAKTLVSYEDKLQHAREQCREGKALIRKAENSSSSGTRNGFLKKAEDVLFESKNMYIELIDAHGNEEGFNYLQREVSDVNSYIYHCQKTRTITQ